MNGGWRVERIGACTLIHGDCLEVLPVLSGAFGAVITDPPYESHMHAAKRGEKAYGSARRIRTDGHANPPPVDFESIDAIRHVVTPMLVGQTDGWCLIFCTPEGVAPWRDVLEASGARYKRACVWVKPDSAPQFNGQGPAMGAENFVAAWCGPGLSRWNGGGRRNVFTHNVNGPARHGGHPTEKPVSLMAELVGLFTADPETVLDEGAQIVATVTDKPPMAMIGHVTSSYYSPTLGRSIAMAMIQGGRDRKGETLYAPMPDKTIEVTVTDPVFFDPDGEQLNG